MFYFTWDTKKNDNNIKKHGVGFADAVKIFDDPSCVSIMAEIIDGEERWRSVGMVKNCAIILVAHTYTDDDGDEYIRIISARPLTHNEANNYGYG